MRMSVRSVFLLSMFALLLACGEPNQRLDEYVFYEGPGFSLKVVRYYRNVPFNYLGEHAVVMCRSENTRRFSAGERQDAGWRVLGEVDARGSRSAREIAPLTRDEYQVFDEQTLIVKNTAFNISFDACGHFINWDPSRLPQAIIDTLKRPDNCAPNGPVDCRYHDFRDQRAPRYSKIRVYGAGRVSFEVSTPAFRGIEKLRVQSGNNGAVWHIETIRPAGGARRLDPAMLRSLPVRRLGKGMMAVSINDWFESALPSRSMVIWPDVLGNCAATSVDERKTAVKQCAEIRFNDGAGNNGVVYVAMHMGSGGRPEAVVFHSGVLVVKGESRPVASLGDLRVRLSVSAR